MRKGDFVGVVAENEWDAIRAARALKVTWQETSALPGNADLFSRMRAAKTSDVTIVNWGDADKALRKGCARLVCDLLRVPTSRTRRSVRTARSPTSARTAHW